jgi:hypothetical protein
LQNTKLVSAHSKICPKMSHRTKKSWVLLFGSGSLNSLKFIQSILYNDWIKIKYPGGCLREMSSSFNSRRKFLFPCIWQVYAINVDILTFVAILGIALTECSSELVLYSLYLYCIEPASIFACQWATCNKNILIKKLFCHWTRLIL